MLAAREVLRELHHGRGVPRDLEARAEPAVDARLKQHHVAAFVAQPNGDAIAGEARGEAAPLPGEAQSLGGAHVDATDPAHSGPGRALSRVGGGVRIAGCIGIGGTCFTI
jgi:hypothetical protein